MYRAELANWAMHEFKIETVCVHIFWEKHVWWHCISATSTNTTNWDNITNWVTIYNGNRVLKENQ